MNSTIRTAALICAALCISAVLAAQEENAAGESEKKPASAIELVEIEPFEYCSIEMTGSYEQHGEAFMKMYGAAGQQGLSMSGAPFGLYWNSPNDTPEEALKWEIGMEVPAGTEVAPPLVGKKWENTLVVRRDFEGVIDSDEIQAVYLEIFQWIEANGYEVAGPMMERFLSMPSADEEGGTVGKVQIVFPVKKK